MAMNFLGAVGHHQSASSFVAFKRPETAGSLAAAETAGSLASAETAGSLAFSGAGAPPAPAGCGGSFNAMG